MKNLEKINWINEVELDSMETLLERVQDGNVTARNLEKSLKQHVKMLKRLQGLLNE